MDQRKKILITIVSLMLVSIILVIFVIYVRSNVFGDERESTRLELSIFHTASFHKSLDLCRRISPQAVQIYKFNPSGARKIFTQSACVQTIAIITEDIQLCDQIKISPLNGPTPVNKEICKEKVAQNDFENTSSSAIEDLYFLLGYDVGMLVKESGFTYRDKYWEHILSNPPDPQMLNTLKNIPLNTTISEEDLTRKKFEMLKVLRNE